MSLAKKHFDDKAYHSFIADKKNFWKKYRFGPCVKLNCNYNTYFP